MSTATASRLAWSLWVLALALTAIGLWLLWLDRAIPVPQIWGFRGYAAFFALPCSSVGALIASRQPKNPIGWLFVGLGMQSGLQLLAEEYAIYALLVSPGSLPGGLPAAWVQNWIWMLAVGPFMTYLPLLFPNGRLLSPRWRPVAWLAGLSILALILGSGFSPRPVGNIANLTNPYALAGPVPVAILAVGGLLLVASMILSTGSVVRRMRLARGEEREQLKWFAYAAALAVVTVTVGFFPGILRIEARWADAIEVLIILSLGAVVVAVGVAILKYRLYAIDLIINRTLVYGPLTAILAGTYVAAIGLSQRLFVSLTGDKSDAAIVLTTLVVASAFTPVKSKLQASVDRYFGHVDDPARALRAFSDLMRPILRVVDVRVIDPEQLARQLLEEAAAAFHAESGAVHLRANTQFTTAHTIGPWSGDARLDVPLEYAGTQLGLISLGIRRDGLNYTSQDRENLRQAVDVVAQALGRASLARKAP